MAGAELSGDREAVLETLRAFCSGSEAGDRKRLGGELLEWSQLVGETPRPARVGLEYTFDGAEIVELTDTRAVAELRAGIRVATARGSWERELRLDGPARLEKLEGRWLIVDFTLNGRRRLESLVFGPLAEQTNGDVTVRVLGIDRSSYATPYVVELVNDGADEISLDRAFGLFETQTAWSAVDLRRAPPVAPDESGTALLHSDNSLRLDDPVVGLALRVRSGARKLPFLLKVPLTRPDEVVAQRAPRHLPLLRWTWPRSLVYYGIATALAAWWLGEWAILVPLFIAIAVYLQIRTRGALPDRLYPFRHAIDALLAAGLFALLWTTAPDLAVPAAVGALVYLGLWRVARRHRELRLLASLAVAFAWFFLLGSSTGLLSPCRLADGSPRAVADRWAHARLAGDVKDAREYEGTRPVVVGPLSVAPNVDEATSFFRELFADPGMCGIAKGSRTERCYEYEGRHNGKPASAVAIVTCDGTEWEVSRSMLAGSGF